MIESTAAAKIYEWRVRAGLISAIASLFFARVTPLSLLLGLGIAFLGLSIRAWACGHLVKEKELATSGPYRFSRNPLYSANFIIGTAIVISSNSWWTFFIFAANFIIFYPVIILVERDRMFKLFPREYAEYSKRVPLVIPSFRRRYPSSGRNFDWNLFRNNKEIRATVGVLAFWALFALKMVLFP